MGRWREGWQLSDEPFDGGRPIEHPGQHAATVQSRQRARRIDGWLAGRVEGVASAGQGQGPPNGHVGRLGCTFKTPQVMMGCTACATANAHVSMGAVLRLTEAGKRTGRCSLGTVGVRVRVR
jgi:hypothetical protein